MSENNSILLEEYCNITRELEQLRNKIVIIKNIAEEKMERAITNKEKDKIFKKFQKELDKVKNNNDIKNKYKTLTNRQKELHNKLSKSTSNNLQQINNLNNKIDEIPPIFHINKNNEEFEDINIELSDNFEDLNDNINNLVKKYNNYKSDIKYYKKDNLKNNSKDNLKDNLKDDLKDDLKISKMYNLIENLKIEIEN